MYLNHLYILFYFIHISVIFYHRYISVLFSQIYVYFFHLYIYETQNHSYSCLFLITHVFVICIHNLVIYIYTSSYTYTFIKIYISSIFFFQFFPPFLLLSINFHIYFKLNPCKLFLSLILTICLYIFKTKFSPFPLLFSLSFCFFVYFLFLLKIILRITYYDFLLF